MGKLDFSHISLVNQNQRDKAEIIYLFIFSLFLRSTFLQNVLDNQKKRKVL